MDKKIIKEGDRVVAIKPIPFNFFIETGFIPIGTKGVVWSAYNTKTGFHCKVKFDDGVIFIFNNRENYVSKLYDMNDEINSILKDVYG